MAERKLVIPKRTITFEGIFNMKELYNFIDSWFAQHGFDKGEDKNVMQVTEQGKYVFLNLLPTKTISDYAKVTIRVEVLCEGYKDITIKKDGINVDMHQGRVNVSVTGFLVTDTEGRWTGKPFAFFMRMIFEKFIYTTFNSKMGGIVSSFYSEFVADVKNFFNMYKL